KSPTSSLFPYTTLFRSNGGVAYVADLFHDIKLAEAIDPLCLAKFLQFLGIKATDIANMSQPVIDESMFVRVHSSFNPTAPVVTTDRKSTRLNSSHVKIS